MKELYRIASFVSLVAGSLLFFPSWRLALGAILLGLWGFYLAVGIADAIQRQKKG